MREFLFGLIFLGFVLFGSLLVMWTVHGLVTNLYAEYKRRRQIRADKAIIDLSLSFMSQWKQYDDKKAGEALTKSKRSRKWTPNGQVDLMMKRLISDKGKRRNG